MKKNWRDFVPKIHPYVVAEMVLSGRKDIQFCSDNLVKIGDTLYQQDVYTERKTSGVR